MDVQIDTEDPEVLAAHYDNLTYVATIVSGLPEGDPQGSFVMRVSKSLTGRDVMRLVCQQAHVPYLPSYKLQTFDGYDVPMDQELETVESFRIGETLKWVDEKNPKGSKGRCWNVFWFLGILSLLIAITGLTTITYLHIHEEPNFQYAVIFDAGSSHTSMFIYKWEGEKINSTAVAIQDGPKCNAPGHGISSYANNTAAAGKSLVSCLDTATERIPANKQSDTSIYLGATAGMRLLKKENPAASEAILESIRDTINGYPFKLTDPKRQVRIIPGSEEGVFSWITSNYITGTFDVHPPTDEVVPDLIVSSVGTLDLGGASTQITFIPNKTVNIPAEDHYLTTLYGTNYSLYTHSYLCFGVNEALRRLQAALVQAASFNTTVNNPCSPSGSVVNITHQDIFSSPCVSGEDAVLQYGYTIRAPENIDQDTVYSLQGESNATECKALVTSHLFNFTAPCPYNRCSFNGVFQPPVMGEFYGISAYFYLMEFLNLTDSDTIDYANFSTSTQSLCAKNWSEVKEMKADVPRNLPWYCFQSLYIDTILVQGYGFDPNTTWKSIHFVQSIGGVDAGWTLGFVINESNQIPVSTIQHIFSTIAFAFLIILFCAFFILFFFFARLGWRRCRYSSRSFFVAPRLGYGSI